jgi:hypothetical protein
MSGLLDNFKRAIKPEREKVQAKMYTKNVYREKYIEKVY